MAIFCCRVVRICHFLWSSKGTFHSEIAGEINRHKKVPKIAPELLFLISGMNFSVKMLIFSFFCINQINLFKAGTTM